MNNDDEADDDDYDFDEMSPPGKVGYIREKSQDGLTLYIELNTGEISIIRSTTPLCYRIGETILIFPDENKIELAPSTLSKGKSWVGVVKLKRNDKTVIDSGTQWILIPTQTDINYQEGNTVEVDNTNEIKSVLHDRSLRLLGSDNDITDETPLCQHSLRHNLAII